MLSRKYLEVHYLSVVRLWYTKLENNFIATFADTIVLLTTGLR